MKVRFQADADLNEVIIPQSMPVQQVADELLLVWMASNAEEWNNRIAVLPL